MWLIFWPGTDYPRVRVTPFQCAADFLASTLNTKSCPWPSTLGSSATSWWKEPMRYDDFLCHGKLVISRELICVTTDVYFGSKEMRCLHLALVCCLHVWSFFSYVEKYKPMRDNIIDRDRLETHLRPNVTAILMSLKSRDVQLTEPS